MPKFEMIDVVSTNISRIAYDEASFTVRIIFESGSAGDFFPMSPSEWDLFRTSKSKGKHFAAHIKPNKTYVPVNLTDEEKEHSTMSCRNPTEKSLKFDESKGRLEQTTGRINNHFNAVISEVTKALREKQS